MIAFLYQRSLIEGRGVALLILLSGNVISPLPLRSRREDRFARSCPVAGADCWLRKTSIDAFALRPTNHFRHGSRRIFNSAGPANANASQWRCIIIQNLYESLRAR
jgi:hypothetical protein